MPSVKEGEQQLHQRASISYHCKGCVSNHYLATTAAKDAGAGSEKQMVVGKTCARIRYYVAGVYGCNDSKRQMVVDKHNVP